MRAINLTSLAGLMLVSLQQNAGVIENNHRQALISPLWGVRHLHLFLMDLSRQKQTRISKIRCRRFLASFLQMHRLYTGLQYRPLSGC